MAGTALTGNTISSTYNALLKTTANTALDSTLRTISDGLGNDSALKLSTTSFGPVSGTEALTRANLNKGTTALTDAATIATDASLGNVFTVTLGGNRTLGAPTNLAAGATYIWVITQDGTGSRTLAYNSVFKWQSGLAPTLTTTAAAKDIICGVSDGTNVYCSALLNLS